MFVPDPDFFSIPDPKKAQKNRILDQQHRSGSGSGSSNSLNPDPVQDSVNSDPKHGVKPSVEEPFLCVIFDSFPRRLNLA
jgi:hypothetical protein